MRVLVLLLLCIPQVSFAAVYISEVAWMGDSASPNNEWIEIYGDESVEGWVLETEDGTPYIELAGTLSGARVLYRGIDYTGALENGGEVLVLKNSSGTEIDRVDGSDGWSLGGDNESKETLQKVNGSWTTGSPSPGNVVEEKKGEESSGAVGVSASSYERPDLELRVPDDFSIVAGSETEFKAEFGLTDGTTFDSSLIEWNFGDGVVRRGGHLYHKYHYPGEYIMIVSARNGGREIEKKIMVSVREVEVSLSRESNELVVLENTDAEDVEISRWRIASGGRVFIFPEDTYLIGGGKIGVSSETAGFVFGEDVVLQYSDGEVVGVVEEEVVAPVERVVYRSAPVVEEKEEVESVLPAAVVEAVPDEREGLSIYVYVWVVLVLVVGGSIVFIRRYG